METTFVVERNGLELLVEFDFLNKLINIEVGDNFSFSQRISDEDLAKFEMLESITMSKGTKKSWKELNDFFKQLF